MKLAIIDYGSGNLRSVAKACERAVQDNGIDGKVVVSSDPTALASASHILLPGVGAFGDCMQGLRAIPGMLEELEEQVHQQRKWFLGICVGMQLLFERGFEYGEHEGLGWMPGEVKRFDLAPEFKVPHMGWNIITSPTKSTDFVMGQGSGLARSADRASLSMPGPLLNGINEGDHAYFVHSYHAQEVPDEYVIATTDYGGEVVAAVARDNIFGTQFHPEKSQQTGIQLLANFIKL